MTVGASVLVRDGQGHARHTMVGPVEAIGDLRGRIDTITGDRIEGWAQHADVPEARVRLAVFDNGVRIGEVVADSYRQDLQQAGLGSGAHAFRFMFPAPVAADRPHLIQVKRVEDGSELEGSPWIWESVPAPPSMPMSLRGHLAHVTRDWIAGWAWDDACPHDAVVLQVLDNDVPIARLVANRYRKDLAEAGIGDGRHGFEWFIPGGLSPDTRHVIQVCREADGAPLRDSPYAIEVATCFDSAMEQRVTEAIDALLPGPAQDHVLHFMAAQTERMLRQRAEAQAQRTARLAHLHFRRRWGGASGSLETSQPPLRALVIDSDLPDSQRDAGSQAILSHMRGLQRLGYAVSFMAADAFAPETAAIDALRHEGIDVCHAPFYASVEEVLRLQNMCLDVIYMHRLSNASRYTAIAKWCCPKARILYNVADLHFLRVARQAAIEERPELLGESRRLRLAECTAAWSADAVLTHSAYEAALLRQAVKDATVHVVPWDVPVRRTAAAFSERRGVAFIGGYRHTPNVDAARFLVEEIMPLVWQQDPSIDCLLVGSAMPDSLNRLAGPRVTLLGQVTDLGAVFDRVRLTVAPLRYGAGIKGKVLASLAAGIPCVMSSVAAEGIDLPESLKAIVVDDKAAMAATILSLHGNALRCTACAAAGIDLIAEKFTLAAVDAGLIASLDGMVGSQARDRLACAQNP